MSEHKPEKNKEEGHKLNRKSFLKILGLSLVSHFMFLNWGKKAWAQQTGGVAKPDNCGEEDGFGSFVIDFCNSSKGNEDKCGQFNSNNGATIPDSCNSPTDTDKCGQCDGKGAIIPDTCKSPTNTDNCGQKDAGGGIISDECDPGYGDSDFCGKKDVNGGIISDSCSIAFEDPDLCGQEDAGGGTIPDTCNPAYPIDPDICIPSVGEPVECTALGFTGKVCVDIGGK